MQKRSAADIQIGKKEGLLELCIGIAEGGARTHDLEVDLLNES